MRHAHRTVISVLLPYRDAASTLESAIQSLLQEEGVELEILAIDDGSRDDGPTRVARIAASSPRVRPMVTGGVGIARALAMGLEQARGAFIARMDGDDISLQGRLACSLRLLEQDERLGAVGTLVEGFAEGEVGEGMQRYIRWLNSLTSPEDHERDIFVESPLCHPSVMLRRSALEAVGGYRDVPWPEDYDLWLRLNEQGYALAKVKTVLFRWRHREGRATFQDPRYALERFDEAKAHYLAPRLARLARPVVVWGAGKTGKRFARALEREGVRASMFVDIDPRKIGSIARGAPIRSAEALARGAQTVVVAVGARGARELIREDLDKRGFVEGEDYICAS